MFCKFIPFSLSNVPNVVPIAVPMRPHVVPNYHTFYPIFLPQSPSLHRWANGKSAVELSSILGGLKVSKLSNLGALKVLETLFLWWLNKWGPLQNKRRFWTLDAHGGEIFFLAIFLVYLLESSPCYYIDRLHKQSNQSLS
jgi:hypothetical protein